MATKTFTAKTKGQWVQLSTLSNFDFVDGKDYTLQVLGTAKFGDDGKTGILIDSTTPYTYTHKSGVDLYVMTENEDGAVITVSDSASLALATRGGGSGGGSGDAVWGSITGTLSDQTDLADALAAKQNVINEDNKLSYNYLSDTPTIPTVPENDNSTISLDASDKLQAIGFKEARTDTAMRVWHGSQQDWEQGENVTWYNWQSGTLGWNTETSGLNQPDDALLGVNYVNNKFFAVGVTDYQFQPGVDFPVALVLSSTDGQTWTKETITVDTSNPELTASELHAVAYGNNVYVAVGVSHSQQGGTVYTSQDGQNWTPSTNLHDGCRDVIFVNGTFYATSTAGLWTSTDGQNWNYVITGLNGCNSIAYGNGLFVLLEEGQSGGYATSQDGTSWTTLYLPEAMMVTNNKIIYANNMFVIVGINATYSPPRGCIFTSTDGNNWQNNYSQNFSGITLQSVAYGNGKFIVVGTGIFNNQLVAFISTDGTSWTQDTTSAGGNGITYGNNKFIAVYDKNIYSYSNTVLSAFTTDEVPTTSSTVYSAPNIASALTITSVGTGTITLSDTNTYDYNVSGNQTTTQSVGEAYPTWLCNIDGVGVKIGTTEIANLASYTAFTGATSSVAGSAGLVPAPTATDNDKYLKGDGTWAAVSGGSGIQNTATYSQALTILGTPNNSNEGGINIGTESSIVRDPNTNEYGSIAIGYYATAGSDNAVALGCNATTNDNAVALGCYANAAANESVAIGYSAKATASGAIQIGQGTNSTADTLSIGLNGSNYQLLDDTGKIPNDRIDGATGSFTSQDGKTVTVTNGVITDIS